MTESNDIDKMVRSEMDDEDTGFNMENCKRFLNKNIIEKFFESSKNQQKEKSVKKIDISMVQYYPIDFIIRVYVNFDGNCPSCVYLTLCQIDSRLIKITIRNLDKIKRNLFKKNLRRKEIIDNKMLIDFPTYINIKCEKCQITALHSIYTGYPDIPNRPKYDQAICIVCDNTIIL